VAKNLTPSHLKMANNFKIDAEVSLLLPFIEPSWPSGLIVQRIVLDRSFNTDTKVPGSNPSASRLQFSIAKRGSWLKRRTQISVDPQWVRTPQPYTYDCGLNGGYE
jgi:hypothetical protein